MKCTSTIIPAVLLAMSPALAEESHVDFQSLMLLPPETLAHIVELEQYGDRFRLAIEQIILANQLPDWGGSACGQYDLPFDIAS